MKKIVKDVHDLLLDFFKRNGYKIEQFETYEQTRYGQKYKAVYTEIRITDKESIILKRTSRGLYYIGISTGDNTNAPAVVS